LKVSLLENKLSNKEGIKMKPGAYTQIFIHIIFDVRNREAVLNKEIRPEVFKYLSGICSILVINT